MNGSIQDGVGEYRKLRANKVMLILGVVAVTLVLFFFSLWYGTTQVTFSEILNNLWGKDGSWEGYVIHDIRLKRAIAAILAGIGLGIAGAAMQSVLRNPLGSPYTLGLSNAAAFGASFGILVLGGGIVIGGSNASYILNDSYTVTISAFLFSCIATGAIAAAMRYLNASPETMILTGMAMSAIFSAGIAFLQYMADNMALSAMVFWQFGDLDKVGWVNVPLMAVATLLPSIYLYSKSWDLNSIDMGDDVAQGLGINVSFTRIFVLIVSALMTSVIVSFVGIIGFIGLLAPHLARRIVGNDKRLLFPMSCVLGALVMLVAMMISEYAFPFRVPVGIITSVLGGPLFLWILFSKYRAGRSV